MCGQKQWHLTISLHCLCSSTSHLFTSHLRLVYWSTLVDSKWLNYFYNSLCMQILYICYCFSRLINLFSVTWLSLLYKFIRFFYLFSVSLWRRANARSVRLYYPYWQYTNSFIFWFVIFKVDQQTRRSCEVNRWGREFGGSRFNKTIKGESLRLSHCFYPPMLDKNRNQYPDCSTVSQCKLEKVSWNCHVEIVSETCLVSFHET